MSERSNWTEATREVCPFCENDAPDLLERRGSEWYCCCCSRQFFAYSETDRIALKVDKIMPT